MKSLFIILSLNISLVSFSQSTFTLYEGYNPDHILPKSLRFLYSEYQDGCLTNFNGEKSKILKFNYDLYTRSLKFIDSKNDTLIVNDLTVRDIHMGEDFFLHHLQKGYLKILVSDSIHSLVSYTQLLIKEKAIVNGASASVSASSVSASTNKDFVFERITEYFIID